MKLYTNIYIIIKKGKVIHYIYSYVKVFIHSKVVYTMAKEWGIIDLSTLSTALIHPNNFFNNFKKYTLCTSLLHIPNSRKC